MNARKLLPFCGLLLLMGCARQPELMPLRVGRSTTYAITHGLERQVESIEIVREVPIAGETGYELKGAMGTSRLAWIDGVLVASQTANGWFDPPIPLLSVDGKDRKWQGDVISMGVKSRSTATLTQRKEKLDLGPKTLDTILTVLTIQMPRGTIELSTWFQSGVGIVQQEQRTMDNLVVSMEMLGGPKE